MARFEPAMHLVISPMRQGCPRWKVRVPRGWALAILIMNESAPKSWSKSRPFLDCSPGCGDHRGMLSVQSVPNYLGVSRWFASSCTDFVVAALSIVDLVGRPHAAGGFVIC